LSQNSLYAPTYLFLVDEQESDDPLPYALKTIPTRPSTKGKRRALHDAEFDKEREWILLELDKHTQIQPIEEEEEELPPGEGIECGCCFANYAFVRVSPSF
jgi:TRIAD3 protein (E3 ubiquitin-protein ligase RNF216)